MPLISSGVLLVMDGNVEIATKKKKKKTTTLSISAVDRRAEMLLA